MIKENGKNTSSLNGEPGCDHDEAQRQLCAEQKRAALHELIGALVHKMRNQLNNIYVPVSNIKSLAEEIFKEYPQNENNKLIKESLAMADDSFESSTRKAVDILSRISDLSAAFAVDKTYSENAIQSIYHEALGNVQNKFNLKDIPVELTGSGEGRIAGVTAGLVTILENLIANAYAAVSAKSRSQLKAGNNSYAPKISVALISDEESSTISVSDNGTGISKALGEKIFRPFRSPDNGFNGSGLGLYTVKSLVEELHSGRLWYVSNPGEQTTFFAQIRKAR